MRDTEPTMITQGEQIEWTRSFSNHPASLWTLQYRFRGAGPGADVAATADGDAFASTLTSTQTAAMLPGQYEWQAWATETADTANKVIVGSGSTTVEKGFVSGETGDIDLRSPAKIMLDTIDAALLAFATTDVLEYEITTPAGSRRVKRSDKAELTSQRKYWAGVVEREIARERMRKGGPFAKAIKARMFSK